MNHARRLMCRGSNRPAGATVILLVIVLAIIIGMVAFAVDVGRTAILREEIQNAVDAGALAAGLRLQDDYTAVDMAVADAKTFVRLNQVGSGGAVDQNLIQVEAGTFDAATGTFTATNNKPNAVRVYAQPSNEQFAFAGIFGAGAFSTQASAIATGSKKPADIMMILDLSNSMAGVGITALRAAAPVFVDVIDAQDAEDQIGVMGLSADPAQNDPKVLGYTLNLYHGFGLTAADETKYHVGILEARLTLDLAALKANTLTDAVLVAGKYRPKTTGTGAALRDACHYLINGTEARKNADILKFCVLMSDGQANIPNGSGQAKAYALARADDAKKNNIIVYTISLGSNADVNLMQQIASKTGGQHFDATGAGAGTLTQQLTDAFRKAAHAIKRVQLVQ